MSIIVKGTLCCIAYLCTGVVSGWKPGFFIKILTHLSTLLICTDFYVDEGKKIQNGLLKKTECFNSANSQY